MGKKSLSEKEYKNEMKHINRIRSNDEFERELSNLYRNYSIPPDLIKKELRKLIDNSDRKLFYALALVLSNFLSAVITTVITPTENDSFTVICFVLLFGVIFVIVYAIVLGIILALISLTSNDMKWRNIRINLIIENTDKRVLASMIHTNAQEKIRVYLLSYIKNVSFGIIAASVATLFVWKIYYHL